MLFRSGAGGGARSLAAGARELRDGAIAWQKEQAAPRKAARKRA